MDSYRTRTNAGAVLCLLLATLPAALYAAPAGDGVPILVVGGKTFQMTTAEIAAMPHRDMQATEHGQTSTWSGVPIADVFARAGIALDKPMRGPELQRVVRVRGADGYVAAFALAEFDPSIGDRIGLLADKCDGKPLDAKHGPWQFVVPQDHRPTRWVRNVVAIEVSEPVVATPPAQTPTVPSH